MLYLWFISMEININCDLGEKSKHHSDELDIIWTHWNAELELASETAQKQVQHNPTEKEK